MQGVDNADAAGIGAALQAASAGATNEARSAIPSEAMGSRAAWAVTAEAKGRRTTEEAAGSKERTTRIPTTDRRRFLRTLGLLVAGGAALTQIPGNDEIGGDITDDEAVSRIVDYLNKLELKWKGSVDEQERGNARFISIIRERFKATPANLIKTGTAICMEVDIRYNDFTHEIILDKNGFPEFSYKCNKSLMLELLDIVHNFTRKDREKFEVFLNCYFVKEIGTIKWWMEHPWLVKSLAMLRYALDVEFGFITPEGPSGTPRDKISLSDLMNTKLAKLLKFHVAIEAIHEGVGYLRACDYLAKNGISTEDLEMMNKAEVGSNILTTQLGGTAKLLAKIGPGAPDREWMAGWMHMQSVLTEPKGSVSAQFNSFRLAMHIEEVEGHAVCTQSGTIAAKVDLQTGRMISEFLGYIRDPVMYETTPERLLEEFGFETFAGFFGTSSQVSTTKRVTSHAAGAEAQAQAKAKAEGEQVEQAAEQPAAAKAKEFWKDKVVVVASQNRQRIEVMRAKLEIERGLRAENIIEVIIPEGVDLSTLTDVIKLSDLINTQVANKEITLILVDVGSMIFDWQMILDNLGSMAIIERSEILDDDDQWQRVTDECV